MKGASSRVTLVTWPHNPAKQPRDSKVSRILPTGQFPLLGLEDEGELQPAVGQHILQTQAGERQAPFYATLPSHTAMNPVAGTPS